MTKATLNRDKMKKVLLWLAETLRDNPGKNRTEALQAAEIRFDLSPKECQFLDTNFADALDCRCAGND